MAKENGNGEKQGRIRFRTWEKIGEDGDTSVAIKIVRGTASAEDKIAFLFILLLYRELLRKKINLSLNSFV